MRKIDFRLRAAGVLFLIVMVGLALRVYNIKFPSIGYHNMKENEYLSQAQEMIREKDYLTKRIYFYNGLDDNPGINPSAEIPLVPYQTIISWKLFGENLWSARLCNILFGLLSIIMMHLTAGRLFRDTYPSMFACFLSAVMPMAVFFSRNIQPESPALFFMLLGSFLYLRCNLFLGGLSFLAAWLYKPSFLVGALPLLFCIQLKDTAETRKDFLRLALSAAVPYFIILSAFLWIRYGSQQGAHPFSELSPFYMFTADYWKKYGAAIWRYVSLENFTPVFTITALLGILFAFLKKKTLTERYIIGWVFAVIPYGMFYSEALRQASFYYMPFLALVCVSSAYCILRITETARRIIKKDIAAGLIIIIMIISMPFIYSSLKDMHATVFLGLDVAGESLKEFTKPDERVFLFTHSQGNAISRYARRYMGWESDLVAFREAERRLNIRYICFYPAEFAQTIKSGNPKLFDYIQNNYHVKEAGMTMEPQQFFYIILEKGEGSDPKTFLQSFEGQARIKTIYRLFFDKYVFFYTIRHSDPS